MKQSLPSMTMLVIVVVALSIGAGCLGGDQGGDDPGNQDGSPETYTLEGKVIDARTEEGVDGVSVAVNDRTTETATDGTFQIDGLQEGNYTLTADRSGYFPTETTTTVGFDNTVRVQLRDDGFYGPNESQLISTHWGQDATCQTCHGADSVEEIQEPPTNATCTECHMIDSLQNSTAEYDPNPHDDPHGMYKNCMNCHRVHQKSVKRCADCHSSSIIPDVP